jgi:hypothetical protein
MPVKTGQLAELAGSFYLIQLAGTLADIKLPVSYSSYAG